ncbi:TerD family protein [Nocardiopsis quinghaiensis]|uniref:TerD family protein n=1 Tax=Nocardiopsis quinghaiensis TaxID=464995 RepID=UPI00123B931A|nr:TerD family protein [Nocardiopsis quinghaiensis]
MLRMLHSEIVKRTLRVPEPAGELGDGTSMARRFDAALLTAGFTCSADLLRHLSGLRPEDVLAAVGPVLSAVRAAVGDHVRHNVYFLDFPANVPDTSRFWLECLADALADPGVKAETVLTVGGVDLLGLPRYGRYQHGFGALLEAHESFVEGAKDRVSVLHLGRPLAEEAHALYLDLAASPLPLSEDDLVLLELLAAECAGAEQPERIPVRENRAVVNRARMSEGRAPLADTVTDVLRLACALSDGDVTLDGPTRFRSFRRSERRALMTALEGVVGNSRAKLGDVARYREPFKRLGERLHPHEYPRLEYAREVFAVARGQSRVRGFDARVEAAFADGDTGRVVDLLATAPGMLVRSLDRVLSQASEEEAERVAGTVDVRADQVAPRVLVSAREHLASRRRPGVARMFVNQRARAWVEPERREPLPADRVDPVVGALDRAIARRLPRFDRVLVDEAVRTVAVPRSGKGVAGGVGVLPRGSAMPVTGDRLRFFVHWRQQELRTDLDLSVQMLDADFASAGQVSWTRLGGGGAVHSGDIVEAPEGATEMIDLSLATMDPQVRHVVPQVLVYAGEGFMELAESFFGFMTRDGEQEGMPFEPRTVRAKSGLRGAARVALPLVFSRGEDDRWTARWLHLFMTGRLAFNQVEDTGVSAGLLARALVERDAVTVGDLLTMTARAGALVAPFDAEEAAREAVPEGERWAYVGLERPDGLPEGAEVFTARELGTLLPD